MKLYLVEDEKYPHVFVQTEEDVRKEDADRAENFRRNYGSEMPASYYHEGKGFRVVPEHLGEELLQLRRRENEILQEIVDHLKETGQDPIP